MSRSSWTSVAFTRTSRSELGCSERALLGRRRVVDRGFGLVVARPRLGFGPLWERAMR
jgi:hypothetical protein